MGWKLVKSESLTLARDKALEFAARHQALPRSPVEREVRPENVKKLVGVLSAGLALPFQWATVEFEGKTVRMNGQHSSAAIAEVGPDLPASLAFHMDRYRADERKDMVELFRQFDQRWSGRSMADIAGAYQGLVPTIANCNRKVTKAAADAICWCIRRVEGGSAPTGDNAYDILHKQQYESFILWLNGIVNGRKELLRPQTLAAIYRTHEKSETGATKFWREVSFGQDYFTDDMQPGAVLIGELSKALEDRDFRGKEFPNEAVYYKKCVKAWNAFCAGQRIASLKIGKGKEWPDISHYGEQEEAA